MIYLALFAVAVFGQDPDPVPCPDYSSELICENCKCFGATKFNYKKNGDTPIITREDCAAAAHAAQATYYSWLRNGAELFCSFNTFKADAHAHRLFDKMIDEPTESEVCGLRQEDPVTGLQTSGRDVNTVKPWKIFKLNPNTENCSCQIVTGHLVERKKKCGGYEKLEHLKHNRTPTIANTKDECAKMAFQAGYTKFSYRTDKEWCMYGHYYSDDVACNAPADNNEGTMGWVVTKNDNWGIYSAECAEKYYTYSMSMQGGACVANTGQAFPKNTPSMAHVACCPDVQHQQFTVGGATCMRKDSTTGQCFADGPKTYTEANVICTAAGLVMCPTDVAVSTCCGSDCAGDSAQYWTASMVSVGASSTSS
jgi:hypothetical protein